MDFKEFSQELELTLPVDGLKEQATDDRREFFQRRIGKITASMVGKLLTGSRIKGEIFGATAMTEIYRIAAERMLTPDGIELYIDELMTADYKQTRWGVENEEPARAKYCEVKGVAVIPAQTGTMMGMEYFTGTPDGYVGNGLLEIKCPYTVGNFLKPDYYKDHYPQLQSNLAIHECEWIDFVRYDPRMKNPINIQRIERDNDYIATLLDRVRLAEQTINEITG